MSNRVRRAWFLIALLVLGPLQVSAVSAGPCCDEEESGAVDSCCVDMDGADCPCCTHAPVDDQKQDEPCSGCDCPLGMVTGTAPALVATERAQEQMSEEVIREFAMWSRTLTPRVVQLDLLRPPKA